VGDVIHCSIWGPLPRTANCAQAQGQQTARNPRVALRFGVVLNDALVRASLSHPVLPNPGLCVDSPPPQRYASMGGSSDLPSATQEVLYRKKIHSDHFRTLLWLHDFSTFSPTADMGRCADLMSEIGLRTETIYASLARKTEPTR